MINRSGQGFVGKQGDNVYAGRDGNAYRRDANGNWSKWENGGWNSAQRPDNSVRDSMLNDSARQRERQERVSNNSAATRGGRGRSGHGQSVPDRRAWIGQPITTSTATHGRVAKGRSDRETSGLIRTVVIRTEVLQVPAATAAAVCLEAEGSGEAVAANLFQGVVSRAGRVAGNATARDFRLLREEACGLLDVGARSHRLLP